MGKNVKIDPERARKNKGVPLLGEVPLLENLRYFGVWLGIKDIVLL